MSEEKRINPKIITAILSRDSKTTTYKFALLRALVDCVTQFQPHKKHHNKGWVEYPLGILIYQWLLYYYPIINHDTFIPQMGQEKPDGSGIKLGIRPEIQKLGEHFKSLNSNHFDEFTLCLMIGTDNRMLQEDLVQATRKIQNIMVRYRMKHLGYSQFGKEYSLVRKVKTKKINKVTLHDLIYDAGYFEIHEELHDIIIELGPVIVGEESIINSWAEFTHNSSKKNPLTHVIAKQNLLDIFTARKLDIRDTQVIRRLVLDEPKLQFCVWTGEKISLTAYDVDHVIPFSVWQNNDIWNLMPSSSTINRRKTDLIPSLELIDRSKERIMDNWSIYMRSFKDRFNVEAYNGLGYNDEMGLDEAFENLKLKCDYLIHKRGLPVFEG